MCIHSVSKLTRCTVLNSLISHEAGGNGDCQFRAIAYHLFQDELRHPEVQTPAITDDYVVVLPSRCPASRCPAKSVSAQVGVCQSRCLPKSLPCPSRCPAKSLPAKSLSCQPLSANRCLPSRCLPSRCPASRCLPVVVCQSVSAQVVVCQVVAVRDCAH